jgi:hypothetical protein
MWYGETGIDDQLFGPLKRDHECPPVAARRQIP